MNPFMVEVDKRKIVYDEEIDREIKKICTERMRKHPYTPCARCRYRDPREDSHHGWCMFQDCPASWEFE